MSIRASDSSVVLFLHTLEPSAISFCIYLLVSLVIVGAHLISLGATGIAYPAFADDIFLQFYANNVIQPVASALGSSAFGNGTTLLLWGAIGWVVYMLIAGVATGIAALRETEHDVAISARGMVHHPLLGTFLKRALWRFFIGIFFIGFTVAVLPAITWCLTNDQHVLGAHNWARASWLGLLSVLAWMVVVHGYLVLIRLYLFRTRVFGELLY